MLCYSLQAQQAEKGISIDLKEATLEEFIKKVESLTDYSFIYGEEVTINHPITVRLSNKTIKEVLQTALNKQPIGFEVKGKHIILHRKEPVQPRRRYTVSGTIMDEASHESLIGANVVAPLSKHGVASNTFGFYSLTLPEGDTELTYSYMGYATQQIMVPLNKDTVINLKMRDHNELQEIVIVSNKTEVGSNATHMSSIEIPMSQLQNTPTVLGEADVMKTIQMMPGVQAGLEGSAGLHVRGGSADQNLILLDGIPVYNIDHIFGFFSVFTPEAVKKVTLFKGSFPARFGGRLSSVIDVRTNDGDMNKYHGMLSVGLLASKIQLEGPIIKGRTSFNVSGRRSYIDLMTLPFMEKDEKIRYYFYDMNAKINHRFSDKARLYLSFYNGKDHYSMAHDYDCYTGYYSDGIGIFQVAGHSRDKMSMNWGNLIASARLNLVLTPKLFTNMTVAYNKYQYNTKSDATYTETSEQSHIENNYASRYQSGIRDWSYMIDFDYTPLPTHDVKFGAAYQRHNFHPEVASARIKEQDQDRVDQDTMFYNTNNSRVRAHEMTAYIEDNFNIGQRLRMNLGVHVSLFNVQEKNYFSVQPRLSARYQATKELVFKASYTQMCQYIHLLTSGSIGMPTDLWVPVTKAIKPMRAHQYSAGAYYVWPQGWELSVEGYYKDMFNVLEYKNGSSFYGSSTGWEDKVERGKGRSMGIEFMLQKLTGPTTGWLSYTLAKSDRLFAEGSINNGLRFPYKYDRRHTVNLVVNHKFSQRIDVSATWMFATGGTATIANQATVVLRPDGGSFNGGLTQVDLVESRNNYRLPASHRLNVGINFRKKTKRGERIWNISAYNVYNAMNPCMIYNDNSYDYYQQYYDETTGNMTSEFIPGRRRLVKLTILPLIPSVSYTFKF